MLIVFSVPPHAMLQMMEVSTVNYSTLPPHVIYATQNACKALKDVTKMIF